MADFAEVYILKQGSLYNINSRLITPVPFEELTQTKKQYQLIDDSYFFYVNIGKLAVSRKKLNTVINNYLQSLFPMDLFAGFALENKKGVYTALIYKQDFAELLQAHGQIFRMARNISTAFCELTSRYQSFLFTDGVRVYEKHEDDRIELLQLATEGTLSAEDVYSDIVPLKTEISIRGVKATDMYRNYKLAAVFVGICYLCFLASGIVDVLAVKKLDREYLTQLNDYYMQAGVDTSADPYGTLRAQAEQKSIASFRVLDVLDKIGKAVPDGIVLDTFSINERLVRIEGNTANFAQIEQLVSMMETALKKKVTLEDSRQTEDGKAKFVIRYES